MITILKIIGVLAALGIAAVLALAAMKPDTFRFERSTTINAPPDKIFPLINNLKNFSQWSPYEKKDPDMNRVYSGPAEGKGAAYEWDGDSNVGKGRLEISKSEPNSKVGINLHMIKPMDARNDVLFTLTPTGSGTKVSWAMTGRSPFMAKIVHVFIDVDKMVGTDFEQGLASLKQAAER